MRRIAAASSHDRERPVRSTSPSRDHAPRIEAIDRVTDLIVIGDRDDVVPRFFDEGGHELTEEHVVLDKKHGDCSCMIGALGDHKPMLVLRTHDVHDDFVTRFFYPYRPGMTKEHPRRSAPSRLLAKALTAWAGS